jgi:hypothetical protein
MLINMDFQSFPQRVSEVFVCDASLQMTCLLSMHKCSNLHIYPRTYAHTRAHTCRHIHMQRPGGALRALAVLHKPSTNRYTHTHTYKHTHTHAASRRGSPCPCSAAQAKLPARARVPFCSCSDGRCTGRNCGRPGGSEPTLGAKVCAFSVCCACVCVCV